MSKQEFSSIRVYPTTDKTLPSFDNTKLVAINTCPRWGLIRYSLHKTFQGSGRAMALEAGAAAHEVFAAHRLFHILDKGQEVYGLSPKQYSELVRSTGIRLFGVDRYEQCIAAIDIREDKRTQCIAFATTALYNSGFYDDPSDKRRTVTTIEEMCIAYMDKFDWSKQMPFVYEKDGQLVAGIELQLDVTIEFTLADTGEVKLYRFIGKADAVHYKDATMSELRVHENKTASRLGDAWELSWETNHQPTGYMIALTALLNRPITHGLVLGSCLPMPKSYDINGISRVPFTRYPHHIEEWFHWFYHTAQLHDAYIDDPLNAPMYTHSCNRYFRPCSFIPLCAVPREEQDDMLEDMVIDEWTPLDDEGSSD